MRAGANAAFDEVFEEFERLEALMTVWRDSSDVSRMNAGAGQYAVPVSPEVLEVLGIAGQISDWTDGKFDVTFGALSGLWRFDHDQDNRIPDPEEVRRRLPLIAYEDIELDEAASTAMLKREGMVANLGGIGKGYAVDRAVDILHDHGVRDFMIQAGAISTSAAGGATAPGGWHPRPQGAGRAKLRHAGADRRDIQHVR